MEDKSDEKSRSGKLLQPLVHTTPTNEITDDESSMSELLWRVTN